MGEIYYKASKSKQKEKYITKGEIKYKQRNILPRWENHIKEEIYYQGGKSNIMKEKYYQRGKSYTKE